MAGDDNSEWLMRGSAAATIIYNNPTGVSDLLMAKSQAFYTVRPFTSLGGSV